MTMIILTDGYSGNKVAVKKEIISMIYTSSQEDTEGKTFVGVTNGNIIVSETVDEVLALIGE